MKELLELIKKGVDELRYCNRCSRCITEASRFRQQYKKCFECLFRGFFATTTTNQIDCSICQETATDKSDLFIHACKHTFHRHCLVAWTKTQSKNSTRCPLCRSGILCCHNYDREATLDPAEDAIGAGDDEDDDNEGDSESDMLEVYYL